MSCLALQILKEAANIPARPTYNHTEYLRKEREARKAAGLCARCGDDRNPFSKSYCDDCLDYFLSFKKRKTTNVTGRKKLPRIKRGFYPQPNRTL